MRSKLIGAATAALVASAAYAVEVGTTITTGDWNVTPMILSEDLAVCVAHVSDGETPASFSIAGDNRQNLKIALLTGADVDVTGAQNDVTIFIDGVSVYRPTFTGVGTVLEIPFNWGFLAQIAEGGTLTWFADGGKPFEFSLTGSAEALDNWVQCVEGIASVERGEAY